jgi:hypothetical protein
VLPLPQASKPSLETSDQPKTFSATNGLAYLAAASVTTREKSFLTKKQGGAAGQLDRKSERTQTSGDGDEELDELANHF